MTPGIPATIFPWMPSVGGVIALATVIILAMVIIGGFLSGAGAAAAGIVLDRTAAAIAPVAIPVCWSPAPGMLTVPGRSRRATSRTFELGLRLNVRADHRRPGVLRRPNACPDLRHRRGRSVD